MPFAQQPYDLTIPAGQLQPATGGICMIGMNIVALSIEPFATATKFWLEASYDGEDYFPVYDSIGARVEYPSGVATSTGFMVDSDYIRRFDGAAYLQPCIDTAQAADVIIHVLIGSFSQH